MQLLLAAGVTLFSLVLGLLWLTALENGGTVAVPLPFSPEVVMLPQGAALAGFAILGALAAVVALLPLLLWLARERSRLHRTLHRREAHLREVLVLAEQNASAHGEAA